LNKFSRIQRKNSFISTNNQPQQVLLAAREKREARGKYSKPLKRAARGRGFFFPDATKQDKL
jgi:hypothetical protein